MRISIPACAVVASILILAGTTFSSLVVLAQSLEPPVPRYGPQSLYGSIVPAGWGFGPSNLTQPGPTIPVNAGEAVHLDLFSDDSNFHSWLLDLNSNGLADGGEPLSPTFSSGAVPTAFMFANPLTPGSYPYICGLHGSSMSGTWIIRAANQPPTIALSNPDGVSTNRWTGGSRHSISWSATDPDGLPSQLVIYLNYSWNGGLNTGTIAGPLANIPPFDWTVPLLDAADVHVTAEAIDPGGAKGNDDNTIPVVDSTRPSVASTLPADLAMGVPTNSPLDITFTETMNQVSAQSAVSLCSMPGCAPVTIGFVSWSANTLRMAPTATLSANTQYQATVAATALDVSDPGNGMGTPHVWTFRTANTPPGLTISLPSVTDRWTGGTVHTIAWSATDAEDPPGSLTVWVNYSLTGAAPWTAIVGPISGTPTSQPWTTPVADTMNARVEITVVDTGGEKTVAQSAAFAIDSTSPTISGTNPVGGAINVPTNTNVQITFSERMNTAVTGNAAVVALQDPGTSAWLPLSFSWDGSETVLTANPPLLSPMTLHRLFVNASAQDGSNPGLTMGVGFSIDFTTSAVADTNPPTVAGVQAVPPVEAPGGSVNISASVTDDRGLAAVKANITLPDGSHLNLTMTAGAGSNYYLERTWTLPGGYSFVIWAVDTSGNADSGSGAFSIVAPDTSPPEIAHTPAGGVRVGQAVTIRATVTDAGVVSSVWLNYTDASGTSHNVTMSLQASEYRYTIPGSMVAGTVTYRIGAADDAGNVNVTAEYSFAVTANPPTSDSTPAILALVLVVVLALAMTVYALRRRKKGEAPPPQAP